MKNSQRCLPVRAGLAITLDPPQDGFTVANMTKDGRNAHRFPSALI
jgi:hypothetical protein